MKLNSVEFSYCNIYAFQPTVKYIEMFKGTTILPSGRQNKIN